MNENQIIQRIMAERYRRSTVCPRYTPTRWWECDVFELTEAGFFREYENQAPVRLLTPGFLFNIMSDNYPPGDAKACL